MEFGDYVQTRRGDLLVFATILTGRTWLADDVVSDALGKAFEHWPRIAALDHPHAYVRRMVLNEFLGWRRRGRRLRLYADALDYDQPVDASDAQHAARDEMLTRLAALPRKQRAAVVLRYYLDLPDAEIAEQLHCREATVRSHISKGLRTLRIDLAAGPSSVAELVPTDHALRSIRRSSEDPA